MKKYLEQIPRSLFDAAEIDGCSPFYTFIKIVIPLSKPALATVGLFYAVSMWNEYFLYLLYIPHPNDITSIQVKLRDTVLLAPPFYYGQPGRFSRETLRSSAIVITLFPPLIIYLLC